MVKSWTFFNFYCIYKPQIMGFWSSTMEFVSEVKVKDKEQNSSY